MQRSRESFDHDVVIAGGGPTGMMLAAELALAEVDAVIVEPRPTQHVDGSRAGGLHSRTIEVLDQRGIAERFITAGQVMQIVSFGGTPLDMGDFPTRHPYGLALWQSAFEPILADRVVELGVPVLREREVVGHAQDDDGVDVELSDGSRLRSRYLVGCDGGRSRVRKDAGIDFAGEDAATSWMIAEVEMDEDPPFGFHRDAVGTHAIGRRQEGEPIRVVLTERSADRTGEPDVDEFRDALVAAYGSDFGLRSVNWLSRFSDAIRQATAYRKGRVLVAGDAAHVHPPQGGQGLNLGVQDAVNLGWKLAQVVRGTSPDALLDTYHAERHPVGARVIRTARAQVALAINDAGHDALRATLGEVLRLDETRRHLAGMLSGLDIAYASDPGHPLVGRRMPDLDLVTDAGPTTVFALLHAAQPVLLRLAASGRPGAAPLAAPPPVQVVDARCDGPWELPVVGPVDPPAAVLVRPDGHVAWAGALHDAALTTAMRTWFGVTPDAIG